MGIVFSIGAGERLLTRMLGRFQSLKEEGWEHKEVFLIGAQYPKINIKPFSLNCEIMSVAEETGINGLQRAMQSLSPDSPEGQ